MGEGGCGSYGTYQFFQYKTTAGIDKFSLFTTNLYVKIKISVFYH